MTARPWGYAAQFGTIAFEDSAPSPDLLGALFGRPVPEEPTPEPCDRPWPCLHDCCVDLLGLPYPTKCSPWCSADVAANIPCLHRMRLDRPEETR